MPADESDVDQAMSLLLGSAKGVEAPPADEPDDEEILDDQDEQDSEGVEDEGEGDDLDDEEEFGSYSDDDLLEVTVDGEKREVSIRDLKARFAGEGAIEKRLQEATETRKAAQAERAAIQQEAEQHRANMLQTVQQLDQFLFMPLVQRPDPALRSKNMNEYLMQKDAFEEDQQRIAQLRQAANAVLTQHQQKQAQDRAAARQYESEVLVQKEPTLSTDEGKKAFQADLALAISHYGFTQEQLSQVDNHALFLMARDAGRYLKLAQKANGPSDREAKDSKGQQRVKRLLKPGSVPSKPAATQAVKARKVAETQARKTGSVDDVAAMLLANIRTSPNQKRSH